MTDNGTSESCLAFDVTVPQVIRRRHSAGERVGVLAWGQRRAGADDHVGGGEDQPWTAGAICLVGQSYSAVEVVAVLAAFNRIAVSLTSVS